LFNLKKPNPMKKLQFKTNIKCGGCLATVTPHLNALEGIQNWEVDITNPDKILTVQTEEVSFEEIKQAVNAAGFKAESL
jgi:copper chaperone CopZ